METKKAPQKDLESKKGYFLQVGFIISLALVLIAFEWSTEDVRFDYLNFIEDADIAIDVAPITVFKEKEEVKPKPIFIDVLIITDEPLIDEEAILIPDPEDILIDISKNVEPAVEEREVIFTHVQQMPQFSGGESALLKYLASSIKYPDIALINGVQGKVYVSFVVNKLGQITQVAIVRSVDPNLDKEALRVISSMPNWEPGMQNNKMVSVAYTLPISFVLK